MKRREFLTGVSALALSGCAGIGSSKNGSAVVSRRVKVGKPRFHVFSKMFQAPVTKSPEELCDLMKRAGADGIQWTVRKGGHATPENVRTELPRLVRIAESSGLSVETICTGIVDGQTADAELISKVAADCGIAQMRTGYYFYDKKRETFAQSMERFRRSFRQLADLGERCGIKAAYQNHSTWGPAIFGGVVWDIYECIWGLDPRWISIEYDPMHAYFETYESWMHGLDLVTPWISAIDLKDFRYRMHAKRPGMMAKDMVAACKGVVPWKTVRDRVAKNGIDPLYVVHFEYDFDKKNLFGTIKSELDAFRNALS